MKFAVIGEPERHPVKVLPPAALPVESAVPAFGVGAGAVLCGAGELCAGWELPGAAVVPDGFCVSAAPGVEFGLLVPEGLCVCAGAGPEGDVLSGVVLWAATQHADSTNAANNAALDFMAV